MQDVKVLQSTSSSTTGTTIPKSETSSDATATASGSPRSTETYRNKWKGKIPGLYYFAFFVEVQRFRKLSSSLMLFAFQERVVNNNDTETVVSLVFSLKLYVTQNTQYVCLHENNVSYSWSPKNVCGFIFHDMQFEVKSSLAWQTSLPLT